MESIKQPDKKRKYRILIVDDSQTNIDYLMHILKRDDYLIATSKNGSNAITKAKGNSFDLILLDVIMDGIDGFCVCSELKKYPTTRDVPIIFLTSLSDPQHITKGFECGAIDYVKKPFNHAELIARVQTHLELKRSKDIIAEKNKQLEETNKELEKLSLVASKTSNSVIISGHSGQVEWVNDGFSRLTGYTLDEYVNLKDNNFITWIDNDNIANEIKRCITLKQPVVYSTQSKTKSGANKWIQTTLTPILDHNGDISKLVAIGSDISSIKLAEQEIKKKHRELMFEKERSEKLLLNILPRETAEELKKNGKANTKYYDLASVLFTDFKGFTKISEMMSPEQLVNELDNYFKKFDEIIENYDLEKIKTIGDSYMCAGGIPRKSKSNPFKIILAGLEILRLSLKMNSLQEQKNQQIWNLRIGIHSGELITGVVGEKKFAYDIWGDTVNTASRMESSGEICKVNISGTTYNIVKEFFECTYRGKIAAKNKEDIDMYFVDRIKPEYSINDEGILPNSRFIDYINELDTREETLL
jgi:PAS domain S-box-containing protein